MNFSSVSVVTTLASLDVKLPPAIAKSVTVDSSATGLPKPSTPIPS